MADEADSILTHDMIAQRALYDLKNELTFSKNVYKGYTSEFHSVGGYQKGSSVRIHLPNKYRAQDGATLILVGTRESNTTVTVDEHKHVGLDFTAVQLTQDIEDFSRKYIRPAIIALANQVDFDGCAEIANLYNQVGTPGTTPSTFGVLAASAQRMDEEAIIREDRLSILSPKAHWTMADGELKSIFQQKIVETMVRKGFIGNFALMDFYMSQNIRNHTTGTSATEADGTSTVQVKVQPTEGDTEIQLKGLTSSSGTITKGDVFTIASVAGVNPVSGTAWEGNTLRQFVCTANVTADVSGFATVAISPAIISSAADANLLPYQTVNDIPLVNDNITIAGVASTAYPLNVCFHPNAFALTMVPFVAPQSAGQSVKWATAADDDLGLAITFSSSFDITNFKEIYRLDILYGWDTIEPNYGVRLIG